MLQMVAVLCVHLHHTVNRRSVYVRKPARQGTLVRRHFRAPGYKFKLDIMGVGATHVYNTATKAAAGKNVPNDRLFC